ncbi:SpoIIE family protein phosphatase [uncultured Microscilla sp.]|uniref:PP2C family protein-serine/threonine phosphatase n=1 Tax=uncultured Microscilla sp. TaxID=432653 RepID=UPI002631A9DB|nr:SpoIIE family protein phosphatase [uncultured Microscilla sp.]
MLLNIVLVLIAGLLVVIAVLQRNTICTQKEEITHLQSQMQHQEEQLTQQKKAYLKGLKALEVAQKNRDEQQQALEFNNQKMQANEQVLIKAYNQLKASQEEIKYQKTMLEETFEELKIKNNRLTDSIMYAKRIQQAILPNYIEIKKSFTDAFIIFLPKDVVSGDFYWFTQIGNKTFIATVDCTGHGVPGAFMSIIGHTLLNQIVREKEIFEPSEILETLDADIYTALRQQKSKSIDGMDLSLCCVETPMGSTRLKQANDKVKVVFCGAKSTLYYSQVGQVLKIKGNRRSLGGWLKRSKYPFTNHEIHLPKGEMLYLTTDGYTDAANPRRRHFGTTKLVKLMAQIQTLPLYKQKQYFEKMLQKHQKGTEQRDDITIVGIRV